jgi:hypothetical protein
MVLAGALGGAITFGSYSHFKKKCGTQKWCGAKAGAKAGAVGASITAVPILIAGLVGGSMLSGIFTQRLRGIVIQKMSGMSMQPIQGTGITFGEMPTVVAGLTMQQLSGCAGCAR